MNEGGSADDLASGTNHIIDDYDGEEDIFPQLGSEIGKQLFALPPSYWRASRCIYEKYLHDPATQE